MGGGRDGREEERKGRKNGREGEGKGKGGTCSKVLGGIDAPAPMSSTYRGRRCSYLQQCSSIVCAVLQAIASRNQLKSVTKQREAIQQQLNALIREKKMQLERSVNIIVL